jgi:hypothetical protein
MGEPWTSNTVEAEPEPVVRVLIERTESLESARRFAVALEQRLAQVHQILTTSPDSPDGRRVRIRQAVRLIEAELGT